jgi:hypothetical protein
MPFHEFREHSTSGLRVQKGNPAFPDPSSRTLVDQPQSRCPHLLEGGLDVIGAVSHVVQSGTVAGQELPDGRVGIERAQQLNVTLTHAKQHRLDTLLLNGLAVLHGHAKALGIERNCLVEVLYGDADVIDASKQGRAV